jgi:hypothetical protein
MAAGATPVDFYEIGRGQKPARMLFYEIAYREPNGIRLESEQISVFFRYPLKPLYIYGLHQEAFSGLRKYGKNFLITLFVQQGCILIPVAVSPSMHLWCPFFYRPQSGHTSFSTDRLQIGPDFRSRIYFVYPQVDL